MRQPFPEEMHRVLVDRLSSVHYAPTVGARNNLIEENRANAASVVVVGNTVVDALLIGLEIEEREAGDLTGAVEVHDERLTSSMRTSTAATGRPV